uniref:Uncharacterized protein n=1 Tax=Ciona intestinalis TaxID=7719 RepID=H2XUW5_CIOIN
MKFVCVMFNRTLISYMKFFGGLIIQINVKFSPAVCKFAHPCAVKHTFHRARFVPVLIFKSKDTKRVSLRQTASK